MSTQTELANGEWQKFVDGFLGPKGKKHLVQELDGDQPRMVEFLHVRLAVKGDGPQAEGRLREWRERVGTTDPDFFNRRDPLLFEIHEYTRQRRTPRQR